MKINYIKILKPAGDFLASLVLLILIAPLVIITTILLIPATNGRPFFTQQRPGRHGKTFNLLKFRTMRDLYDENGNQLPDKFRITKIGQFIRSTSLDELPQLLNVLKGDMSLVGPRPLLVKYLTLYNNFQARRHEVKPGITGWTQVNGRNALCWEKKFEMDVWYVDHVSFMLDIKIILLTIKKVIIREGISQQGQATTVPFLGKPKNDNYYKSEHAKTTKE
jgi:lipopolysaccharide/colanic/teichoic acid biosynthesis glycosyltransferase